jgi:hypothetical protein
MGEAMEKMLQSIVNLIIYIKNLELNMNKREPICKQKILNCKVNRYIYVIIAFSYLSCSDVNSKINQNVINGITSKTLIHLIHNKCFDYDSFGGDSIQNVISISKNFVLKISDKESIENLDSKIFLKSKIHVFKLNDTFHISNLIDKKVVMSNWSDIALGYDFQYILEKKVNVPNFSGSVCSYVFSLPNIIETPDGHQILFKVMRYFDHPVEYCYVLLKTNKKFEINSMQCYKEKKQIIPKPPAIKD